MTSYFPKRGEEQVAGWNKDGAAPTMVEWTASGQDMEVRVDQETCCRVLDISDGAEGERRIGAWADGEREGSIRAQLIGPVSWAGAPGLGYAGSFPGAPPQDPMGSPSAGISRCLLPCSVLRRIIDTEY